jgi:hypothetical protein
LLNFDFGLIEDRAMTPQIAECDELIAIFVSSTRTADENAE